MSYPMSTVREFDYRKAQMARGNQVRGLKNKDDLLNLLRDISYRFVDSDWLMGTHSLDVKKLREFAVFVDWSIGRVPSRLLRADRAHKFETDHLYAFLGIERRRWSEIETLWIQALDTCGTLGGFDDRTEPRPGAFLSKLDIIPTQSPSWPLMLLASFWRPDLVFDTSYLRAVQQSAGMAAIRKRYATSTELWIALVDGEIQLRLPIDPRNELLPQSRI